MLNISLTTRQDLPTIESWLKADPWHSGETRNSPAALLSGSGALLCFQVQDDKGTVFFIRLDKEGDLVRVAAQFGPEEVVSKRRVILGLAKAFLPAAKKFAQDRGYKGLVFESVNPKLIAFMDKLNFKPAEGDDYVLRFEVEHV